VDGGRQEEQVEHAEMPLDEFHRLTGLALTPDQTHVVVVDSWNHRLVVLDAADGRPVSSLSPTAGVKDNPHSVLIVPHRGGQVLVSDWARGQVLLFAGLDAPQVVVTFGDGPGSGDRQLNGPSGLALIEAADVASDVDLAVAAIATADAGAGPALVAIADTFNHRVVIYRWCDCTLVRHFGTHGGAPGQFAYPQSIAVVPTSFTPVDHRGWLVVGDNLNTRVQVVTQIGQPIRVIGLNPLGYVLGGITVCLGADGQAEILVGAAGTHCVLAFALDGSAARLVCGTGKKDSGTGTPSGLVLTAAGDLWVTDSANQRVCLFR
jgi:DNA-binding beta-propeller fold protein YncE